MSYHILHQFDEQWLADLTRETDGKKGRGLPGSFDGGGERRRPPAAGLSAGEGKRWAVVAAGILLAGLALLFSVDAGRRAESLQQRVDRLEQTAKK